MDPGNVFDLDWLMKHLNNRTLDEMKMEIASTPVVVKDLRLGPMLQTPLFFIVLWEEDYFDFLRYFVEDLLVSVDAEDTMKQTALYYASREGRNRFVRYMLDHSKIQDKDQITDMLGQTPLFYAISTNKFETVEILFNYGFKINVWDNANETPLYYAMKKADL